jgi:transcriptional repressor NrdR
VHCPFCRHPDSRVVDSRETEDGAAIRRRRSCPECGKRFTTVEIASLTVLKRSGATEPFSRAKVVAGVRKACSGRPVDEDALAVLAQQVEEAVRGAGAAEIAAHDIGLAILGPLRDLDEVAYLRFASVYRGFDSLADFELAIAELRAVHDSPAYEGPAYEGPANEVWRFGGAHDPAPPPESPPTRVPATSGRP